MPRKVSHKNGIIVAKVDGLKAPAIKRAKALGLNLSGYVRRLIERDLR